ncbi:Diaminohydroxyphosphoribosylaminopyrimidine deaminase / 5-amino-6-(5-phosphoribosylamino)uracil reductase [hydrothermal vent metagenome]|uniref:Diaminohydroxyphosphoribosylaminopyrimidine deaminase / 5-amino-6-(5-phosphoribosylamino)uracil reductase n=1 Tax=hydrothermal vent metagenome TaxID=652676 RepID=A0A1W1CUS7_9ZZZZ
MKFSKYDIEMMSHAISLAKKGIYTARPNPMVGCVIVKNNTIIGQGYHQKYGGNHAEINALEKTKNPNGSTVYLTLEPCFHTGKTPPCVDDLIKAKVKKVIIAMLDVNPLTTNKSVKKLQQNNIEVLVGLLEKEARELNKGFIKRITTGIPFIRAKIAMSLDGKTAMQNGESKWITGEEARADVQKLRAESDVILTGVNTILLDNPSLTVRDINCTQPLRIILDRNNRLKNQKLTVLTDKHKTLILNENLNSVLKRLGKMEINNVLLETGSILFSAMLKEKLIDEIIIYTAPILLGKTAKNILDLDIQNMADKIKLTQINTQIIGNDTKTIYEVIN